MFQKLKAYALVAVGFMFGLAGLAHAALPTEVDTAATLVVTDGTAMATKGYAIVAAVTGAFIMLKLFKRVLTRST